MAGNRQLQISLLVFASLLGIVIGVWLLRAGFVALGCTFIALFLWRGQQFAIWLAVPRMAPADVTPPLSSWWQRLLLSIVCLLGAGTCAVGVYLWRMWPEEWQVGLVFILFGLIVLAPVTMWAIRTRRSQIDSVRGE